jgi:hypothetical protein
MQIFNCFLPPVNLVRTSSWAKENDDKSFSFDDSAILIKRGVLIHGEHGSSMEAAMDGYEGWTLLGATTRELFVTNAS